MRAIVDPARCQIERDNLFRLLVHAEVPFPRGPAPSPAHFVLADGPLAVAACIAPKLDGLLVNSEGQVASAGQRGLRTRYLRMKQDFSICRFYADEAPPERGLSSNPEFGSVAIFTSVQICCQIRPWLGRMQKPPLRRRGLLEQTDFRSAAQTGSVNCRRSHRGVSRQLQGRIPHIGYRDH